MRKIVISICLSAIVMAACQNASKESPQTQEPATVQPAPAGPSAPAAPAPPDLTTVQFLDSAKNIGKITEGEKVEIAFKFINTGDKPLVISNVVPSCGCTVAEKPQEPVAPGKAGLIKASFNSQGRIGNNHKTITVYANTEQATYPLSFDVEVVAKQ